MVGGYISILWRYDDYKTTSFFSSSFPWLKSGSLRVFILLPRLNRSTPPHLSWIAWLSLNHAKERAYITIQHNKHWKDWSRAHSLNSCPHPSSYMSSMRPSTFNNPLLLMLHAKYSMTWLAVANFIDVKSYNTTPDLHAKQHDVTRRRDIVDLSCEIWTHVCGSWPLPGVSDCSERISDCRCTSHFLHAK